MKTIELSNQEADVLKSVVKKEIKITHAGEYKLNLLYNIIKKLGIVVLMMFSLSSHSQLRPKTFFTVGTHGQGNKLAIMGSSKSFQVGGMVETNEDIGLRFAFTKSNRFEQLDLQGYFRFFQSRFIETYFSAGAAWELANGVKSPAFGFDANIWVSKRINVMLTWQPVIKGYFKGSKGWVNHAGVGLVFKLYREKCGCK